MVEKMVESGSFGYILVSDRPRMTQETLSIGISGS
jgi:hypothetical protein